jgi:hypothetical protein
MPSETKEATATVTAAAPPVSGGLALFRSDFGPSRGSANANANAVASGGNGGDGHKTLVGDTRPGQSDYAMRRPYLLAGVERAKKGGRVGLLELPVVSSNLRHATAVNNWNQFPSPRLGKPA